jgi:hypothetical protein
MLDGKPEGKRPLGRPRHEWEDNIRMNHREIRWEGVDWMHLAEGWEGVDWMHLAEGRDQCQALVNMVMNLQVL